MEYFNFDKDDMFSLCDGQKFGFCQHVQCPDTCIEFNKDYIFITLKVGDVLTKTKTTLLSPCHAVITT